MNAVDENAFQKTNGKYPKQVKVRNRIQNLPTTSRTFTILIYMYDYCNIYRVAFKCKGDNYRLCSAKRVRKCKTKTVSLRDFLKINLILQIIKVTGMRNKEKF